MFTLIARDISLEIEFQKLLDGYLLKSEPS